MIMPPIYFPYLGPQSQLYTKNDKAITWTKKMVYAQIPYIESLKGVEKAWLSPEGLMVRTRAWKLKHPESFFPLSQLDIRIPILNYDRYDRVTCGPAFKYVKGAFSATLNAHPSMVGRRIGHSRFSRGCIGEYENDYAILHDKGDILGTVLMCLTMLQTIEHE